MLLGSSEDGVVPDVCLKLGRIVLYISYINQLLETGSPWKGVRPQTMN